jgi:hypothetical protein
MSTPIQVFKRKLTNLSSANPLLWMGRLKAGIQLDLAWLEQNEVKPTGFFLDQVLEGKKKVPICLVHNPRFGDENQSSRKLAQLVRNQETLLQERGVNDMFLAWPFVAGRWPDGSYFRTPFLFIPLRLEKDSSHWSLHPELERAILNPAYLLAYAHHFSLPPDPDLYEKELDLESESRIEFLRQLYEKIKGSNLHLNFNSDLFSEPIHPFQNWKKSEPPAGFEPGTIKLRQEAALGLFSFSDSLLLPDFEFLEKEQIDLESIFLKPLNPGPGSELAAIQPLEADGSQEECLQQIQEGHSLVVQGPPGTGKSQLIANVMARMASMGRSVLLVCQKRVALEVVRNRLTELGVGEHLAMWADFKNDVAPLYQQIGLQIERLELIEEKNKDLSTVVKERSFWRNAQEMQSIVNTWQDWRDALFNETEAGMHWLELTKAIHATEIPTLEADLSGFKRDEWLDFLRKLRVEWSRIFQSRSPGTWLAWRSDWIHAGFSVEKLQQLSAQLGHLRTEAETKGLSLTPEHWEHWKNTQAFTSTPPIPEISFLPKDAEANFLNTSPSEFLHELKAQRENWERFKEWGFYQFLSYPKASSYLAFWEESQAGRKVWFRIQSIWQSGKKEFLRFLKTEQRKISKPESLPDFIKLSAEVTGPAGFLDKVKTDYALIPSGLDLEEWISWSLKVEAALEKWIQFQIWHQQLPVFVQDLLSRPGTLASALSFLQKGQSLLQQLKAGIAAGFSEKQAWNVFLHTQADWLAHFQQQAAVIQAGDASLQRFNSEEKELIFRLLAHPSFQNPVAETWLDTLDQIWLLFWRDRLWILLPGLHYPEDQLEKDRRILQDLLAEKRTLSRELLKLRVEENSYKNLERNRLQNRITYRGLYQQVSRKRKRQPLRSLWEPFGEEILRLVPCWLATPESVSATFPMSARFDLVIFDEASQCFAENGIPAAFRGRQLLVLGDDKQLPPNQLFSTRWEEDGDLEEYFTGQDSLLDLARQFLPRKMLKGHYRSAYPELIQFSNAHFYQNQLEVIPAPETLEVRPPRIEFHRVNGVWENQQNELEAGQLVRDLLEVLRQEPHANIGIITFNQKQQLRIEEELEYQSRQQGILLPGDLFVKNIENVQGDERDQIWFSIGYAPSANGKWIQQFGSLSQEGGENRLNVAISRARQRIRLYSSVWPGDFHAQENGPQGPSLLKKYLEMAAEWSAQREVNTGNVLVTGSLNRQFDLRFEQGHWILQMNHPDPLYGPASVKDLLAIRPAYLEKLGYQVRLALKWDFFTRQVD